MIELKENITHDELLSLLKESENRVEVFNWLKTIEPTHDEVKGVKLFLEMNDWDYLKLEQFVSDSEKSYSTIKTIKSKNNPFRTLLKVAAVLIPFIAIGSYLVLTQFGSNSVLYAKYYEKEIGLPVLMNTDTEKTFNESMGAFKDNEYKEALSGFQSLLSEDIKNDTLLYFSGCSYMELNDFANAILKFEAVPDKSVFKEKSEYRLVLMYIEENDLNKAKKLLHSIASEAEHTYNSKAKEILKEGVFN